MSHLCPLLSWAMHCSVCGKRTATLPAQPPRPMTCYVASIPKSATSATWLAAHNYPIVFLSFVATTAGVRGPSESAIDTRRPRAERSAAWLRPWNFTNTLPQDSWKQSTNREDHTASGLCFSCFTSQDRPQCCQFHTTVLIPNITFRQLKMARTAAGTRKPRVAALDSPQHLSNQSKH